MIPAPSIGTALAFWIAPGPVGSVGYGIGKAWLYGLPLVFHLWIDRGGVRVSRPVLRGLGTGLGLGLGISAVIWGAWLVLRSSVGADDLERLMRDSGLGDPGRFLAAAAYLTVINSLLEEYVFRWFMISRLRALVSPRLAVVLAAAAFTLHHVLVLAAFFGPAVTALASAGTFAGGVIWGRCYVRFGSIWPGYLSHAVVDAAVMAIGWQLLYG